MADKNFIDEPMLVVVSDALDPRIKRQLQSQLQAEMMTVGQLDAEIKNQESMQAIKQQYDSNKDESKFDENETKEEGNAAPVEQTANTGQDSSEQGNDAGGEADPFSGGADESGNQANDAADVQQPSSGDQPDGQAGNAENNGGDTNVFKSDESANESSQQQGGQPAPAQADQSQSAGGEDPFGGESGQAQTQQTPKQNSTPQQGQGQQPENSNGGEKPSAGAEADDPFSDDVKFEAFAGIFNDTGVKFEDADKQTDAKKDTHPPLKQMVYIPASDRGVDERTSIIVSSLEDPQNTVVVIDTNEVSEAEAKMQFASMKKSLQDRGVTVVDTTEQAVEYLNDVYDQIAGKAE